jgi:hypothetical protein
MLNYYYVNLQPKSNGVHEVHKGGCNHLPYYKNRVFLGLFTNCEDAVLKAKQRFITAIGCRYCCNGYSNYLLK